MKRVVFLAVTGICLAFPGTTARAWWDTIIKKWQYPPLVQAYEAETLSDVAREKVVADDISSGGKAVLMAEGTAALVFSADLTPSTYVVYVVGRSPRSEDVGDPAGMKPVYFHVRAAETGTEPAETWRVRAAYQSIYPLVYGSQEMARCYFIVPRAGKYRVQVTVGPGSTGGPLLVDRLELRDVLGNCAKKGGKTGRTMITDAELRNLREGQAKTAPAPTPAEIRERCEAFWASFPPINAPRHASASPGHYRQQDRVPTVESLRSWTMNPLDAPWALENKTLGLRYTLADFQGLRPITQPFVDDGWGMTVTGLTHTWGEPTPVGGAFSIIGPLFQKRLTDLVQLMQRKAIEYEKTGDPRAGLDGTALLLAFAYRYPALDFRAQAAWTDNYSRFYFTNHIGGGIVTAGLTEGHAIREYVRTYDRLFDFLHNNQAVADFLAAKVPGVRTPADVVRMLDVNLLQRTADVTLRGDVAGDPLKMSWGLALTAICQGANDISQKWIDTLFTEIPMGMIEPGSLEDMAYGDLGRDGLVSKGSGGYSKGSIMQFMDIAELLTRYAALGGRVPLDLTDARKYPWFRDALYAPLRLRIAGGWVPLLGDYGHPLRAREVFFDSGPTTPNALKPYYLACWRATGDPQFAFLTHRYGRTTESPDEWAAIQAAARKTRDPLNTLPPRVLDDLGLAYLETGQQTDDFTRKWAATLRYGIGHTHGHNDGLDLAVWGKGMRAISDLAARAGSPSPRLQKMHNTVEVDRASMNNGDELMPGWGWLNAFAAVPGVQYADAEQRARSHPQIRQYRRGVALIEVGPQASGQATASSAAGAGETDCYVFSVQRVTGGKVHTWCAHANQNDRFEVNAELRPAQTPEVVEYLAGFKTPQTPRNKAYTVEDLLPQPMEGKAPDALVATWRLHTKAEKSFLNAELSDDRKVFARWRLFGHAGETLCAANGWSDRYNYDMSFLYVQDAKVAEAGSVYPALAEVYQGQPVVQQARALRIEDPGEGADRYAAVEVKLPGGVTDVCLAGVERRAPGAVAVEGGLRFDGLFGLVRRDRQGLARAVLIGGRALEGDGFSIRLPQARLTGEVISTDLDNNACIVKTDATVEPLQGGFRAASLAGRVALFYSPAGRSYACTVKAAEQTPQGIRVVLQERLKIFQSAVTHVDEAERALSVVAEPYNLKADQTAYDFTEVANESGTRRWPARIVTNTRWMILKSPVGEADIPDRNGDGKRTLALIGNQTDKEKSDKPVLELEITRVDPATGTVYFKTPPAPYDIGGWEYVRRVVMSESGKKWMGTYPGIEYKVLVDGPVKQADFDDRNGDGRRLVSLYRFRPGFRMVVPSVVAATRTASGQYAVEAFTPAEVKLPRQ